MLAVVVVGLWRRGLTFASSFDTSPSALEINPFQPVLIASFSRCFAVGTPCDRNVKARIELHRLRVPATPQVRLELFCECQMSSGRLLRGSAEPLSGSTLDVILARLSTGGKVDGNSVGILPGFAIRDTSGEDRRPLCLGYGHRM